MDDDLIRRAGVVVVDYKEGAKVCRSRTWIETTGLTVNKAEAGELISSHIADGNIVELGHLVTHSQTSQYATNDELASRIRASGDVTIFKSVGVGVQDVAIAHAVVDRAREKGVGTVIDNYGL